MIEMRIQELLRRYSVPSGNARKATLLSTHFTLVTFQAGGRQGKENQGGRGRQGSGWDDSAE